MSNQIINLNENIMSNKKQDSKTEPLSSQGSVVISAISNLNRRYEVKYRMIYSELYSYIIWH
jgi:hypothetical protein